MVTDGVSRNYILGGESYMNEVILPTPYGLNNQNKFQFSLLKTVEPLNLRLIKLDFPLTFLIHCQVADDENIGNHPVKDNLLIYFEILTAGIQRNVW